MSHPRIGSNSANLVIDPSRSRETPPPATPFKDIVRGSAAVLLAGARVASSVVGLPVVSAAVSQPRIGGATSSGAATDPTAALLDQRYDDDLKLLSLQDQIQRHNRQISLLSNVMKARHETAKAAIGNLRS